MNGIGGTGRRRCGSWRAATTIACVALLGLAACSSSSGTAQSSSTTQPPTTTTRPPGPAADLSTD